MNDINKMPPKCQYCPYWEICRPPYVCPDIGDKKSDLQPTCNQLTTDAISRHGVSAWLDNMGYSKLADVVMDKDRFPSAQPEIIHCKDCIYRSGRYCHYRYTFGLFIAENHYCKFAKRQEESK